MIIGLSLLVLLLSYVAWRKLSLIHHPHTAAATSANHHHHHPHHHPHHSLDVDHSASPRPVRMWPFLSVLAERSGRVHPAVHHSRIPSLRSPAPPSFSLPVFDDLPHAAESDGDVTPTALKPTGAGLSVPSISLDDGIDDDDDTPPSFPALNSAQRASGPANSLASANSRRTQQMLPPPRPSRNPNPAARARANQNSGSLQVRGVGAAGAAATGGLTLPGTRPSSNSARSNTRNRTRRIILEPGHSPLDWARLQRSGIDLRVSFSPYHSNFRKVSSDNLSGRSLPAYDQGAAITTRKAWPRR